ncbi:uncharacterized protein LOC121914449 [Sceloporus undulatus]|uniref:uncharacterized protein LOC121914449 n=1 Tax=Sceloporus undulatus TaxID=8520 RepID=UPI001C4C08C3|nr:uncharacterized protein LOC121914449 [Sceloporus undulatus]
MPKVIGPPGQALQKEKLRLCAVTNGTNLVILSLALVYLFQATKSRIKRVKNAVFSCATKQVAEDLGSPPILRKPRRTHSGHKAEPSQTFPPENLPASTTNLEVQDEDLEDTEKQESNQQQSLPEVQGQDTEEGICPMETLSAIPVSTDAELPLVSKTSHDTDLGETEDFPAPQEKDTSPTQTVTLIQVQPIRLEDTNSFQETQESHAYEGTCQLRMEIQQPPNTEESSSDSTTSDNTSSDESYFITKWSLNEYSLNSSTSTVDEELDVPILSEQSQFSIQEKNVWVHNMCQKFTNLPSQMRDHMGKTVAQRHLLSVLEHCFESDEHECIEFLAEIVKSPKCNLDVVIRFFYDKANEGSWLPEEGEEKLRVKVKAARYLISVIKWVCDPKKLMYWYDLLASTYMNIWNKQPRRSEEDAEKNDNIYLHPGEIVYIIRILKDMQQDYISQILPDVAD